MKLSREFKMGSPDATNEPKAYTNPPKYGLLEWVCLLAIVPVSLWLLFGEMDFEPEELVLTFLGLFLLWAPVTLATFVVIRKELSSDLLSCFVLSVITSYGATTALYFFFSVLELWIPYARAGFLLLQCLLVVNVLARPSHRNVLLSIFQAQSMPRMDSILIMILLAVSLVNSRYKHLYQFDPLGNVYRLKSNADQTYYTSMAYECSRGVPMRDTPYRAGIPPRAYHMFPHLTTSLIGKVTGQTDLTRAHLMYEYTFIETMLTLAVFCMARTLTNSRLIAYFSAGLIFLGPIPTLPITESHLSPYFYASLWPQATSMIQPVLYTSPQMYSSTVLTYGIFLGCVWIAKNVASGISAWRIAGMAALLVGVLIRCRVQTFLPILPAFGLLLVTCYRWSRDPRYLLCGVAAFLLAVILYMEMKLPVYRPTTHSVQFGNSKLTTIDFLQAWPGSDKLHDIIVAQWEPGPTREWIWQVICVNIFVAMNVLGLPVFLVLAFWFLPRDPDRVLIALKRFLFTLVLLSIAGACTLYASYDQWSVGGQMLLHINWYLYPFLVPALVSLVSSLQRWMPARIQETLKPVHIIAAHPASGLLAALLIAALVSFHMHRYHSFFERFILTQDFFLTKDEVEGLDYMRNNLPENAAILVNKCHGNCIAVYSGLSGRKTYLEYFPSVERYIEDSSHETEQQRQDQLRIFWGFTREEEFLAHVPKQITHVIEYVQSPLPFAKSRMKPVWKSTRGEMTVWEIPPRL